MYVLQCCLFLIAAASRFLLVSFLSSSPLRLFSAYSSVLSFDLPFLLLLFFPLLLLLGWLCAGDLWGINWLCFGWYQQISVDGAHRRRSAFHIHICGCFFPLGLMLVPVCCSCGFASQVFFPKLLRRTISHHRENSASIQRAPKPCSIHWCTNCAIIDMETSRRNKVWPPFQSNASSQLQNIFLFISLDVTMA